MTLKVISLYLFSMHSIVLWGEYPTYSACMSDKHHFERKFVAQEELGILAADCMELGKTTEEFLEQEGELNGLNND